MCRVLPKERAKAIIAHFRGRIPPSLEEDLADVITRAIKRAVCEQLGRLEIEATQKAKGAEGRGKTRKGQNPAAMHYHDEWARRFRELRTGKRPRDPLDLSSLPQRVEQSTDRA